MAPSTALATFVATLAGLRFAPTVVLHPDEILVPMPPETLTEQFRTRMSDDPDSVLAAGSDRIVRRFAGTEGRLRFRTIELVTIQPDKISFEHLAGPFSYCQEQFTLQPTDTGTRIRHTGSFRLRGGIWTAPLALTVIRSAFETHVRRHLHALAAQHRPSEPTGGLR